MLYTPVALNARHKLVRAHDPKLPDHHPPPAPLPGQGVDNVHSALRQSMNSSTAPTSHGPMDRPAAAAAIHPPPAIPQVKRGASGVAAPLPPPKRAKVMGPQAEAVQQSTEHNDAAHTLLGLLSTARVAPSCQL